MEFSIDKSNWTKVKFGDVVFEPKESVKDARAEGIEHVVGLEHIDSEDIHLRRSNSIDESTTFTKKFSKGDVLFGRRRAYLKKAAQAGFSGICSGDITVMRANEKLLPELLPFLVNNDKFFDWAVQHSAGGLSPRVKFKDLAEYEFLIPSLTKQTELAKLFLDMDDYLESKKEGRLQLITCKHSLRKEVFLGFDKNVLKKKSCLGCNQHWEIKKFSDVCEIKNTLRKPINKETRKTMKGQYPYYGPTGILDSLSEYRVDGEYVLLGEDGDHFLKYAEWEMSQFVSGKFNVNNHAHIIKGSEKCLTKWLFYTFQHRNLIPHISRQGATRYKLNKESLEDILLLVPPENEQEVLIDKFDAIEKQILIMNHSIRSSVDLQKSLTNQVF